MHYDALLCHERVILARTSSVCSPGILNVLPYAIRGVSTTLTASKIFRLILQYAHKDNQSVPILHEKMARIGPIFVAQMMRYPCKLSMNHG